ncbi:GyrI-like domain-containing protein [Cellulophaga sp. L1A9]|uniref:GyrI-like domain-containing protein n=1 Tax=Cellulophaga sp. L1A9 TaxID=2686362 RepID=UPI00131D6166|nr:GyrI-like domain-containing protein [Cellulophaga sp. L1A9]
MEYRIETLLDKKLVGKQRTMSFNNDSTAALWGSFMPHKKLILNTKGSDLFSLQKYPKVFNYQDFDPNALYLKWAAIEVTHFDLVPNSLETYTLKGGLYAVFKHVGTAMEFRKTFDAIFLEWLPNSEYEIDDREHFELLGAKYSNTDPNSESEEEIWIPIRLKSYL